MVRGNKVRINLPNFSENSKLVNQRRMVNLRTRTPNLLFLILFLTAFFISPLITKAFSEETPKKEAADAEPPGPSWGNDLPKINPSSDEGATVSNAAAVNVSQIQVIGNTVFTQSEISRITSSYSNRTITAEELQQVRHDLTLLYVNRGYINSGVVIPDQKITNGVITLQAIEGRLADIAVSGNKRLHDNYIIKRIAQSIGPPLNVNNLQQRLQLLHQDPLIRRINAELSPGGELGEAELKAMVTEERPYRIHAEASNHHSPSVGGERMRLHFAYLNVTGWGDAIGGRYGIADGMDDIFAYYRAPLNARDTMLEFYYEKSDAAVVEQPFNRVDINSESMTYGVSVTHPVFRSPGKTLTIGLKAEKRHSETYILGEPFSFAPGVLNGESDVTVLRFSQEWTDRSPSRVLAMRSVFNLGIDTLDSTVNETEPDSKFLTWLGQIQLAKRLPNLWEGYAIFRADFQLAETSLLPIEQFSLGGATSVRGYREDLMIRDNGVVASAEFRFPILRLPIPKISLTPEDGIVQLAVFADFGWGWNTDLPTPDLDTIYSVGVGLRWDPSRDVHAEIYWGYPMEEVNNPNEDLQDAGIHFQLTYRAF